MALIRPSLLLDFSNGRWPEHALGVFSRGGSAGAFTDAIGVHRIAPADAVRLTYDPETGASLGLLIEPQRTNLLLYSEQFENAAWTKTGCGVSANAAAAPDGATTADLISVSAASGAASQAVTGTAGYQIGLSVYAKRNTANNPLLFMEIGDGTNAVRVWFNLDAGTVAANTAGGGSCTYSASAIKARQNGWYRCMVLVNTTTATAYTAKLSGARLASSLPASGDSVYLWGAQLENFSIGNPTSYIPTTSASATRSGDQFNIALGSWFNATEGSLIAEAAVMGIPQAGGNAMVARLDDGTSSNVIQAFRASTGAATGSVIAGGVTQATIVSATSAWPSAGVVHRLGLSWQTNAISFALDGASVGTDAAATVPTGLTTLRLGSTGTGATPLLGTLGRLMFFNRKLADADLVALTA